MYDLQKCYREALRMVKAVGIEPHQITSVKAVANKRAWGTCHTQHNNVTGENKSRITINSELLNEESPYKSLLTTMCHEILHACDECTRCGHRGKWREYANLMNKTYDMDIKQYTARAEKQVPIKYTKVYTVKCSKCGEIFRQTGLRMPKMYSQSDNYFHNPCEGSHLIKVSVQSWEEFQANKGK